MRHSYALALAFLLCGCAHHPLDCATGLIAWDDCEPGTRGYEMRHAALNRDDQLCQSWGAVPGTDTYVNCRASLANASAQQRAAIAGAIISKMATPQPAQPYQIPTNPKVHCTTRYVGDQAYMDCQ